MDSKPPCLFRFQAFLSRTKPRHKIAAPAVLLFLLVGCAAPNQNSGMRPHAPTSPEAKGQSPPDVISSPLAALEPLMPPYDFASTCKPVPSPDLAPGEQLYELGRSVNDRPILMHVFGDIASNRPKSSKKGPTPRSPTVSRPCTLIFAGIHGNERNVVPLANRLIEHLRHDPVAYAGRSVVIIPVANPDGWAQKSRTNANGVDLNRNFPAKNWRSGPSPHPRPAESLASASLAADASASTFPNASPARIRRSGLVADDSRTASRDMQPDRIFANDPSAAPTRRRSMYFGGDAAGGEPETRILANLVERLRPDLIISVHNIADGRHCNNFDGPAKPIAEAMHRHNGYPVKPTIGYPTPGSFGSWAGIDRGIPVITLELPRSASSDAVWQSNRDALLAAIDATNP